MILLIVTEIDIGRWSQTISLGVSDAAHIGDKIPYHTVIQGPAHIGDKILYPTIIQGPAGPAETRYHTVTIIPSDICMSVITMPTMQPEITLMVNKPRKIPFSAFHFTLFISDAIQFVIVAFDV